MIVVDKGDGVKIVDIINGRVYENKFCSNELPTTLRQIPVGLSSSLLTTLTTDLSDRGWAESDPE